MAQQDCFAKVWAQFNNNISVHTKLLGKDYQHTSEKLGPVPDSAYSMRWGIPRAWYWVVLDDLVLYSPLVFLSHRRRCNKSLLSVRQCIS